VGIYGLFYVWHAAVANFYIVFVDYFIELVLFRKFFIHDFKEVFCNSCGYILAVWWIVPNNFSFSV